MSPDENNHDEKTRDPDTRNPDTRNKDARREEVIERILLTAEAIPPGRVLSYGDIAEIVGCGPRQVGSLMRSHGHQVPWWRVVSHAGDLAGGLLLRARPYWDEEGIDVKPNGLGCRINDYRADLEEVAAAAEAAFVAMVEGR